MQNLPCEVVRDLLPSYVDGLTSQTTTALVEAHLDTCPDCRAALAVMREPDGRAVSENDQKELDFLKKNKRRNRRIAFASILAALALLTGLLGARLYVTGDKLGGESVYARTEVEGEHLELTCACMDSLHAVSNLRFSEKDGVVTATARSVLPSFLHRGDSRGEYTASAPIREVRFNDRILWSNGKTISAVTSRLYNSAHDYVGDMPANRESADALGLTTRLGSFTNELDTENTPYVWHINLEQSVFSGDPEGYSNELKHLGYALLAVVGNLDEVRFEYTCTAEEDPDSQSISFQTDFVSVTSAEATAWFGQDIKACARDISLLEDLLSQAGLTSI